MTIALITEAGTTPAGTCPVCHAVMDESGCRIGARWTSEDLRASAGVVRILDVYCVTVPAIPEVPTAQQIGTALKNLREALGLSIKRFAGACTLSPHRLRQIESGEVMGTTHEHRRILHGLGFTVLG